MTTGRREAVEQQLREIDGEARRARRATGKAPLGVRRILRQDPHHRPERFHAATWRVRKGLELAYYEFRIRFRQAAENLRRGQPEVEFPAGCFPPPLPFARAGPAPTG